MRHLKYRILAASNFNPKGPQKCTTYCSRDSKCSEKHEVCVGTCIRIDLRNKTADLYQCDNNPNALLVFLHESPHPQNVYTYPIYASL